MPADTYDSVLGLILMGTGNNNNNWGNDLNNSALSPAAQAIAGINTITNTSGTVDLSTVVPPAGLRLDLAKIQLANGLLTGDLTIKVPNLSKTTEFWNQTSGAFNMFVQVPGGAARTGPNAPGGVIAAVVAMPQPSRTSSSRDRHRGLQLCRFWIAVADQRPLRRNHLPSLLRLCRRHNASKAY